MNDPVAYHRESLHGWITSAPEDEIRALMRVRRNLDSNLRKPSPAAGWRPLNDVHIDSGLHIAHIARLCRDVYSAQGLARICTLRGRLTWCIDPSAVAKICANRTPTDAPPVPGSASADERQVSANREGLSQTTAQNVRTADVAQSPSSEPHSTPVPTAIERTPGAGSNLQSPPDIAAPIAPICKLPASPAISP